MNVQEVYLRIKQLFEEIRSTEIKSAARKADDHVSWTRRRNMPLDDILICTLAKKGLSAVIEIRQFFQSAGKVEQTVSKQDYFKQRQNLNPEVFKLLNQNYLKRFYNGQEAEGWLGYLVMAVDGSRAEIPNSEENRQVYGESINQCDKSVARANISVLHDVFNRFILDIGIHHYCDSEIEEAKAHITILKETVTERPVLIMFDRNYASLEFVHFLEKSGVKYLIRLHERDFKAERAQMHSTDEEVEIAHTPSRIRHIRLKFPEQAKELEKRKSTKVRIIKAKLDNGERVAFMTNLGEGSTQEIQQLYRKRWMIEQKYHTLKNKLKFESVTGKASIYVKQDFWAQMIVFNMVQDLITAAQMRVSRKAEKNNTSMRYVLTRTSQLGCLRKNLSG